MLYEADVRTFFQNASMDGESIVSSVKGSDILITETLFSTFFELPSEGLTSFSEIPINTYSATISSFFLSNAPVATSGKKNLMKIEF